MGQPDLRDEKQELKATTAMISIRNASSLFFILEYLVQ
jgi:hypothetical protein